MQEGPETRAETPGTPTPLEPKPLAENALLKFVQRPRILLILLAVWEIIGALTEFFSRSGLFLDIGKLANGKDIELNGALAGRALGWEQIPLAVLYLYCSRDPRRYRAVFWLALIEQAAAIIANIYHWGRGDFSIESVIIPIVAAAALGGLVFLHLFQPKEAETASPASATEATSGH